MDRKRYHWSAFALLIIVLVVHCDLCECSRSRGGSRSSSSRSSPSRSSPSRSSWNSHPTSRPATYRPATYRPATFRPATFRPATFRPATYRPATYSPATFRPATYRPATYSPATYRPATYSPATFRPATFKPATYSPATYRPATYHPATQRPVTSGPSITKPVTPRVGTAQPPVGPPVNTRRPTARPSGWVIRGRPTVPPANVIQTPRTVVGPAGRPYPVQQWTPGYNPNYHPSSYQPVNKNLYAYQPPTHHGGQGGNTHVTIINKQKVNYYSPGIYHPPSYVAPPLYYPSYHYSTHDTGSTSLGFFLGYSLGRMNTPTYHYYGSHYDSYRPQYDHYTVHHYYHNSESVRPQPQVEANTVVMCVGDSSTICPSNTYALCTSSGSIMCVADASRTYSCNTGSQVRCVSSQIPCTDNTTRECFGKPSGYNTTIDVPCIYTTKLVGNVSFVENTIVVEQPPSNATTGNTTNTTGTSGVIPLSRQKRYVGQEYQFCVAVVAQPAARTATDDERLLNGTRSIFNRFLVKAIGIPVPRI